MRTRNGKLVTLAALAGLVLCTAAPAQAGAPGSVAAHAARTASLHETATLKMTRNSVSIHEAEGPASGTLHGRLYLRIHVETASRMSATFSGRGGSNSIAGSSVDRYSVSGSILHFSGTANVLRGTGTFAHVSGSGIKVEGTLNRAKNTITMTMSGQIHT